MTRKRILIIPDVHGRTFWIPPVVKYGDEVDRIIFLGDYVDPYTDAEGITVNDAIQNLKEIIDLKKEHPEKVVLLYGNHCLHYAFDNITPTVRFSVLHSRQIKKIYRENSHLFKVAHSETVGNEKFLFTHAGLMRRWCDENKGLIGTPTAENLNRLTDTKEGIEALWQMSEYRQWLSPHMFGSILWSDIRERLYDDPGNEDKIDVCDYQIFGHTQLKKEPYITSKGWACLDCRQAFVLTDNGLIIQV